MVMANTSWTYAYAGFIWNLSSVLGFHIEYYKSNLREAHLISNLHALVDMGYVKIFWNK